MNTKYTSLAPRKAKIQTKNMPLHIMLIPPVVLLFIFSYLPMYGIVMAFQDYQPGLGVLGSEWVGLKHFRYLFSLPSFRNVIWNTVYIAGMKIVGNIIVPVVFALLLNELRLRWFKRTVQTITYLPYFLSWVIFAGILKDFLAIGGPVNNMLTSFGCDDIYFLGDPDTFPYVMVLTDIWKNFGFNTIVYLAALTGIDPNLYEAASVDGANRLQQTWHVTLPGMVPIITLMSILSIGSILSAGFDQIFNLYSPMVYKTGDVLDTFIYRVGLQQSQFSVSTAVGLLKSVVSTVLILVSHKLAARFAGYRVF